MLGRKELDTNALLVLRTFVNLFDGEEGRGLLMGEYEKVWHPNYPLIVLGEGWNLMSRFLRRVRLRMRDRVVNL
jgi:hypothetical protein